MNRCKIFIFLYLLFHFFSCNKIYTPKPRAYCRIDFPKKQYHLIEKKYPFSFEIPTYMHIEKDRLSSAKMFWINLMLPKYKSQIHISYYPIKKDVNAFLEDAHKLAYKHTVRADAISCKEFTDSTKQVYALLYLLDGNVASYVQFTATDDTHHFLRGSLYFSLNTKKDSIQPVIDFIKKDIFHLINTLEWN